MEQYESPVVLLETLKKMWSELRQRRQVCYRYRINADRRTRNVSALEDNVTIMKLARINDERERNTHIVFCGVLSRQTFNTDRIGTTAKQVC